MKYVEILKLRYRLLIKYMGSIFMIAGLGFLLPLILMPFRQEEAIYAIYFLIPAVILFMIGLILYYQFREVPSDINLNLNEGGVIVVFSWIIVILFSAFPFIGGMDLTFTQAVFEAVSGWTTTGLSVIDVQRAPDIFLLWRSIMQLFGGAGLAVIALSSILPMPGPGLYNAEGRTDRLLPHVKHSTLLIMKIYLGYTAGGIILYYLFGMNMFDAVNHAMAAISTGGFSTVSESIGYWNNPALEFVTMVLMLLGTINFATHYTLLQGKLSRFFNNAEIKLMGLLLVVLLPLLVIYFGGTMFYNLSSGIRNSLFQLISAMSTTGFSTIEFNLWPLFANFIIILLMLIGGGSGSTAGGIKQFRVYIILKSVFWQIKEQFLPRNQVRENFVWRGETKWYIENEHIKKIANYIILYLLIFSVGVLVYLAYGYSLGDSMFEFASAMSTVGLSVGISGAGAPAGILWVNIIGMFLGRLEMFIIILASVKLFKDVKYGLRNRNE